MQTGIDRLFKDEIFDFKNRRVGLLIHPASVDSHLTHTLEIFNNEPTVNLTRLFGPEHGLWGNAQDMEGVDESNDPSTHLPISSLYGHDIDSLKPKPKDMSEIDLMVCDLQDIGTRYYTFIYTMAACMEACAEFKKEFIVLDRPNPLNGTDIEGPLLQKGFESFVGRYPIPVRHGMTIGELAVFFNEEFNIGCNLHVVKMKEWKRESFFDETGLPWVLPSPNMPTPDTALVYPGSCLMEATNLSEGRGTTRPFETIGAPFIDSHQFSNQLDLLKLPGVIFRPVYFKPGFQKWAGKVCGGLQIHVTDRRIFKPFLTGVAMIKTVIDLYPNDFAWRDKPYEFVTDIPAIDLLSGSPTLRHQLEAHAPLDEIKKTWEDDPSFLLKRKRHLMYD